MIEYDIMQFAGIEFPFQISYGEHKEVYPLHTHNFTELTIITGGSAGHIVEESIYPINRGEIFAIVPPLVHGLTDVKNLEHWNIIFDLDKLMLLDTELKKLPGFQALFILEPSHRYHRNFTSRLVLNEEQLSYAISVCRNIEDEYIGKRSGYRIIIKMYLLSLISFISRHLVPDKESISGKYFKISETVTFIEENYSSKIILKQLANMAFLSERQYSRIFKAVYNTSPIDYIINCRLSHACDLMQQTQFTLTEISEKCGFGGKVSFSKLFKQRYGITPGQYRKK